MNKLNNISMTYFLIFESLIAPLRINFNLSSKSLSFSSLIILYILDLLFSDINISINPVMKALFSEHSS